MLRLGEENPTAVILSQRLTGDLDFAAVAFAEQQAGGITLPSQQHRTASFL